MADLSITASSVLKSSSGVITTKTAHSGVTITQGQALYDYGDGTVGLSDSNGSSPANTFFGIALTAASPGQPVVVLTSDSAGYTVGATVAAGQVIYVSNTPGGLTVTYSDIASASTVIVVGVATSTTAAILSPITGGVKP